MSYDEYVAYTDKEIVLGNLHVNELSIHGLTSLSLEFKENSVTLSSKDSPFRLVREHKRLIVNQPTPVFLPVHLIDDEEITQMQEQTNDLEVYLELLEERRAVRHEEERIKHNHLYDESNMITHDTWSLTGSALKISFFNLNTTPCTLTLINRTAKFQALSTTGLLLAPYGTVYVKKGAELITADDTVYVAK